MPMLTNCTPSICAVHQSGELETLLENNGVIPKVEAVEESSAEQTPTETKDKSSA